MEVIKGHDNFRREFPLLAAVDRCSNREFVTFTVHGGDNGEGGMVVFPPQRWSGTREESSPSPIPREVKCRRLYSWLERLVVVVTISSVFSFNAILVGHHL